MSEKLAFQCAACGKGYKLSTEHLRPEGTRAPCKQCGAVMVLFPDGRMEGAVPVAAEAPPPQPSAQPAPATPGDVPQVGVVACPSCGREHRLDLSKIPAEGKAARCKGCASPMVVFRDGSARPYGAPAAAEPPPSLDGPKLGTGDERLWEMQYEGELLGPLAVGELLDMARRGALPPDRMVRPAGSQDFAAAARWVALLSVFEGVAASGPARPDDAGGEEPLGDAKHCFRHDRTPPARQCQACSRYMCERCVINKEVASTGHVMQMCPVCQGPVPPMQFVATRPPFYKDWLWVLGAPFANTNALIAFAVTVFMGLLTIATKRAWAWGFAATFIITVFQWFYYAHVVRETANGRQTAPKFPDMLDYGDAFMGWLRVFFTFLILFLPVIMVAFLVPSGLGDSGIALRILLGCGATIAYLVILPGALGIVCISDEVFSAVNPVVLIRTISGLHYRYFILVAFWGVLFGMNFMAGAGMARFGMLGEPVVILLRVYSTIVGLYALGRMFFENREHLGWK